MNDLTTYPTLDQGTPEWLDARRGIVTASVVGKLITPTLKIAANDTSRGLVALLAAERITGVVEPTYTSDAMMRGRLDEPLARDLYSRTYSPVREMGFMTRDLGDGAVLGYSPDGLVGGDGLIEVKSREPHLHLAMILGAPIPHMHMAQMQAGLLVSGREWCDYISYAGGMPMWHTRVEADPEWFVAIPAAVIQAEADIRASVAAYNAAVEGLPPTGRIDYFGEIEV